MDEIRVTTDAPGFTAIPTALLEDDRKSGSATIAVYACLARFAGWNTGEAKPSIRRLAKMGKTSTRKVQAALAELQALDYVKVTQAGRPATKGQAGQAAVYHLVNQFGREPASDAEDRSVSAPDTQRIRPGYASVSAPDTEREGDRKERCAASPPRSKKKSEEKTPVGYKSFVDELLLLHEKKTGAPFVFTDKHGAMVKRILKTLGPEKAIEKLRAYYKRSWWFTKDGHSLGGFVANVNEIGNGHDPAYPDLSARRRREEAARVRV